jgi:hypothetical protein
MFETLAILYLIIDRLNPPQESRELELAKSS